MQCRSHLTVIEITGSPDRSEGYGFGVAVEVSGAVAVMVAVGNGAVVTGIRGVGSVAAGDGNAPCGVGVA